MPIHWQNAWQIYVDVTTSSRPLSTTSDMRLVSSMFIIQIDFSRRLCDLFPTSRPDVGTRRVWDGRIDVGYLEGRVTMADWIINSFVHLPNEYRWMQNIGLRCVWIKNFTFVLRHHASLLSTQSLLHYENRLPWPNTASKTIGCRLCHVTLGILVVYKQ